MDLNEIRQRLRLTLQTALLGEITCSMRGITCAWGESELQIRTVIDGEITEEVKDSMDCVETEVMASMPGFTVKTQNVRRDYPENIKDLMLMAWVYMRKEA